MDKLINDQFNQLCQQLKIIGASLALINQDAKVNYYNYGYSDLENQTKFDQTKLARVASVAKMIGSLALFKLYQEAKLDFDQDISYYLGYLVRNPFWPDQPITVKMLMLHTSSIKDGHSSSNDITGYGYQLYNGTNNPIQLEDLLTKLGNKAEQLATFDQSCPGTKWIYSNFTAGIIACIVEKITKTSFNQYLKTFLFDPLKIKGSFKISQIPNDDSFATLYSFNSDRYRYDYFKQYEYQPFQLGDNFRGPAGGLFISNQDLIKINQLLLNYGRYQDQEIFTHQTVELMYQYQMIYHFNQFNLTKAFQMEVIDNHAFRGAIGGAYGLRALTFFNLDYQAGFSLIINGFKDQSLDLKPLIDFAITKVITPITQEYQISSNQIKISNFYLNHLSSQRMIHSADIIKNEWIKLIVFSDLFSIVGQLTTSFDFKYQGQSYHLDQIVYYDQEPYLNFPEVIKLLNLSMKTCGDQIIITNYQE